MSTSFDYISRIIIPGDWKTYTREKKGNLFCIYKSPNEKTINGKIFFTLNPNDNTINFQSELCGLNNFHIEINDTKLNISFDVNNVKKCISYCNPTQVFKQKKSIYSIDVTEGGLGITSDSASNVFIWTLENGEIRRELKSHCGDVYACCFFPSGLVALTGGADTQIKIWKVDSGECAATLLGHQRAIVSLEIVEKGRNILSASKDGCIRLWDVGRQNSLHTFDLNKELINCIHLMHTSIYQSSDCKNDREIGTDGKVLFVGLESKIFKAFSLSCRTPIFSYESSDAVNCCTTLSEYVVAFGCQDSTVNIIDIRKNNNKLVSTHHSRSAILSMLPNDTNSIYVTSADGSCFLLDINDLNKTTEFTGPDCEPIYGITKDHNHLYTCCRDANVRKYKLNYI